MLRKIAGMVNRLSVIHEMTGNKSLALDLEKIAGLIERCAVDLDHLIVYKAAKKAKEDLEKNDFKGALEALKKSMSGIGFLRENYGGIDDIGTILGAVPALKEYVEHLVIRNDPKILKMKENLIRNLNSIITLFKNALPAMNKAQLTPATKAQKYTPDYSSPMFWHPTY